jgi:hypothetical protein
MFRAYCVGWRQDDPIRDPTLLSCSEPAVWDGDIASALERAKTIPCSEPTAWDGDQTISRSAYMLAGGVLFSEPTVWDGDVSLANQVGCSPLCSKPTVWDGDQLKDILRVKNTLFRSEPTVWDNSPILCYLVMNES